MQIPVHHWLISPAHNPTTMQKANSTSPEDVIAVSVVSFGNDPVAVALPAGATVAQALAKAGIVRQSNTEIFCSGETAEDADVVQSGDVLSIVTPKQAGADEDAV